MSNLVQRLATHSGRLERWLGPEHVEHLSKSMVNWYGPPIPVAGVPGNVWAMKGGDFRGRIRAGQMSAGVDFAVARILRSFRQASRRQDFQLNTGFASLSDLISEATTGKRRVWNFNKAGSTGVVGVTNSLWGVGPSPAAGNNAANAPGGESPVMTTQGAIAFDNVSADTRHFTAAYVNASFVNTLLLHDRIFQVNKTMNSTATEAVTGVPTRYQSTTATAMDYIGGNFLYVEVGGTALAATAHNWTVCTYTDQANAASTLPSLVGNASAIVRRLDHPAQQWFAPLETNDVGIKALTQMQCSALVATGVINFVLGHPIAWIPIPLANITCQVDGINTAFNLERIFDNAALGMLEVIKPATNATTYTGTIEAVHG